MICGGVVGKRWKSSARHKRERKLNELWRNKTMRDFNEAKSFDFTWP
jgi:hypothetical protein